MKLIFCGIFILQGLYLGLSPAHGQSDPGVNLVVKLDNIESGPVTVSQLMGVGTVSAAVINATDGTPIIYTVDSFTLSVIRPGNPKDSLKYFEGTKGNALTKRMKEKIAALKPGYLLIIKDVSATSPQNIKVSYGSTEWTIVQSPTHGQK